MQHLEHRYRHLYAVVAPVKPLVLNPRHAIYICTGHRRSQSAICNLQSTMVMRAPAVLLNVVLASALGGLSGYLIAQRASQQELAILRQKHDAALIREQELRSQLESAFAARAALEQQARHLETELAERLQRLEDLAAKLTPAPSPPTADTQVGNGTEEKTDSAPQED